MAKLPHLQQRKFDGKHWNIEWKDVTSSILSCLRYLLIIHLYFFLFISPHWNELLINSIMEICLYRPSAIWLPAAVHSRFQQPIGSGSQFQTWCLSRNRISWNYDYIIFFKCFSDIWSGPISMTTPESTQSSSVQRAVIPTVAINIQKRSRKSSFSVWRVYLRNGLVDIHPACKGVNPEVLRLFTGHRVCDGCVGAEVIVMSCHAQETGPNHGVLTKEICGRGKNKERRLYQSWF